MISHTHAHTTTLAILLACTTMLYSCTEGPASLVFRGNVGVTDECFITADPSAFRDIGTLDISLRNNYVFFPNIRNTSQQGTSIRPGGTNAPAPGGGGIFPDLNLDSNDAFLTHAEIEYELFGALEGAPSFGDTTIQIGGFVVDSGGGAASGSFFAITPEQGTVLAGLVPVGQRELLVAKIQLFGTAADGTSLETRQLAYPIEICNRCMLALCETDTSDGCPRIGQDGQVLCLALEVCTGLIDEDLDGLIDCNDPDCASAPSCILGESCSNGIDDNGDTLVDCLDPKCVTQSVCTIPENCNNNVDDDGDSAVDCLDTECVAAPACDGGARENCSNGIDDDGDGAVDCMDGECSSSSDCIAEVCTDGIDNDSDGAVDCNDSECTSNAACPENCTNGVDDNGDSLIDCLDLLCSALVTCIQENCNNNVDENANNLIDCEDPDCTGNPVCNLTENCVNGVDDDRDNVIDCMDNDCATDPACIMEICNDMNDNDGDGDIDCADSECMGVPPCP